MPEKDDKKIKRRRIVLYIVAFLFICGMGAAFYSATMEGRVKKGFLRLHGWVEGTEVSLSAKVRGELIKLTVDESDEVKKGDCVAQIDSDQIQSQIENTEAQIAKAEAMLKKSHNRVDILGSRLAGAKIALSLSKKQSAAKIEQAEASIAASKAVLEQCESNFSKAEKDYVRFSALAKKKSISQSKMDAIDEAYHVTNAQVERSTREVLLAQASLNLARSTLTEIQLRRNDVNTIEKELDAARTDEDVAKAVLDSASASKREIEATLADTFIYSPVKGTVTDKVIELGENVVPGTPIVVITDMEELYVKTYVEQRDIGKVKLGSPCRIYVDSFPDRHYEGRVILVGSKAEFTPRDVQMHEHRSTMVYKIKVGIDNPEGILKPGMPADIDLKWDKERSWK